MKELKTQIAEHPFMSDMKPEHFEVMMECATEVQFAPGEIIFKPGSVADRLYLLLEGQVAVEVLTSSHEHQEIQSIGPGDALGYAWLFAPYMWCFQARALNKVRAAAFNGPHLLVACEEDHELGFDLMKRLAQVLIYRLKAAGQKLAHMKDASFRPAL